jgi:hypothetical protein
MLTISRQDAADRLPEAEIEAAVKSAYQREFGATINHPAIYNSPQAVNCSGEGHLMTTAYFKASDTTSQLLSMYMSRDGRVILRKSRYPVLTPAGIFYMLVLVVRYPQTIAQNALSLLEDAQKEINQDHVVFAARRGYSAPLVVFKNTNIIIDRDEVGDPRDPVHLRATAERRGLSLASYQIIVAIDINPASLAGGTSHLGERLIYLGNYDNWKKPLGAGDWRAVARAVYHHEVAHHWGWPATHDWARSCGGSQADYAPFVVPPVLFGWEDLDGDNLPEILNQPRTRDE